MLSGCTEKPHPNPPPAKTRNPIHEPTPKDAQPQFHIKQFTSAAAAVQAAIHTNKPRIVGFGEFHQSKKDTETRSAIARFSEEILPVIAPNSSDLIVETWQPLGCGKTEERVVAEVKEVTERPKQTESEVVRLIKKSKKLDVQPHILKVTCNDYEQLFQNDAGTMDLYEMLVLVGRLLKEKAVEAFHYRNQAKQKLNPTHTVPDEMVLVYGGAIHNDSHPDEGWDEVAFGPHLFKTTQGEYLEIDLYVPEFIEANPLIKEEPWYPLFQKHASQDKVILIQRNKDAYTLILKRGITTQTTLKTKQP
ncbi:MAG: hypothetical protein CMH56_09640 [Myxococcales bacterium]|nr:hypothetical protein [Myxococcales bacterium]